MSLEQTENVLPIINRAGKRQLMGKRSLLKPAKEEATKTVYTKALTS